VDVTTSATLSAPERRRRNGRPPLVEGQVSEPAMTTLPPAVYDEICRIASREGVSVAHVLRYAVVRWLRDERGVSVSASVF
jgi:hypothetical protein